MDHLLDNNLLLLLIAGFLMWMPGLPNGLAQLGMSTGLLAFFGIISKYLPTNLGWVPWLSCVFTLLAQLVLLQHRVMHHPNYRVGQRMMGLHPNCELVKAMLGQGIAALSVLTIIYKHSFPPVVSLVLISTSVGLSAIWAGLQMRDTLPYFATGVMKLGVAVVLFTYFGLVSMYLPADVVYVPWICCVLSCVAALLS